MLSDEQGMFLLRLARRTVEDFVFKRKTQVPEHDPDLDKKAGVFCTIHKNGRLRGCIGLPYPVKPIIEAVVYASWSACEDPRFPILSKEELDDIKIELSILSQPQRIRVEEIRKGDGVILKYGDCSALFLPQVWKQLKSKEEFLTHLSLKAGLSPDMWKNPETEFYKFSVQILEE